MIAFFILVLILAFAGSFLITAGIIYLICWVFALTFSWKLAFGIWLVMLLLSATFKSTSK